MQAYYEVKTCHLTKLTSVCGSEVHLSKACLSELKISTKQRGREKVNTVILLNHAGLSKIDIFLFHWLSWYSQKYTSSSFQAAQIKKNSKSGLHSLSITLLDSTQKFRNFLSYLVLIRVVLVFVSSFLRGT